MGRMKHLRTRIYVSCSLLLVVTLAITCVWSSLLTLNIYKNEALSTSHRDLSLVATSLQTSLNHLSRNAIALSSDSRVIAAAKEYPDAPQDEAVRSKLRTTLGRNIASILASISDLYMWDMFSLSGNPFGVSGMDMSRAIPMLDEAFFERATAQLSCQIHGPFTLKNTNSSIPVFVISKTIVDLDTRQVHGLLLFVIRESRISSVFSNGIQSSDVSFLVLNREDIIVSSKDKTDLGQALGERFALDAPALTQMKAVGELQQDVDGINTLFVLSPVSDMRVDWQIMMVTLLSGIHHVWQSTIQTMLIIVLATFAAMLVLSYLIANSITRPINQLAQAMQGVAGNGNLDDIPVPRASDEVKVLYRGMNDLMARIRILIDHINQEQEEKSNYRFRLIQAQLNPHFLYNSLQTIKSLIDLNINDTASECVSAMSTFYRLSLNKGDDILTVFDELELSSKYMYIQKLRYVDRLRYVFDVPKSLGNCLVPKMTLQPILENAIYHGIKEKEGMGLIEVIGRDAGDTMVFSISDNGNGMGPQALAQLRAEVNSDAQIGQRHASFGLYSVNRRIKLCFGEPYGLTIDSQPGECTVLTLVIPKRTTV